MIKKLYNTLTVSLIALLAVACVNSTPVPEDIVARVLSAKNHYITTSKDTFTFWREVCTKNDIEAVVYKVYVKLDKDGMEEDYYPDPIAAKYAFKGRSTCYGSYYTNIVPEGLPNGVYEYRPIVAYRDKDELMMLPTERVIIDR